MAHAYSHDLRSRVLEPVAGGTSRGQATVRNRIGIATVVRWAAQAVSDIEREF